MAGYYRHILLLPIFVRKAFTKMDVQKIYDFLQKKLINRPKKTVLRNNAIWYAFYTKLATFGKFEKVHIFSENSSIFSERSEFWKLWEVLLFQSRSTAQLANWLPFSQKKFFLRNVNKLLTWRERILQTWGWKNVSFERKILLSYPKENGA